MVRLMAGLGRRTRGFLALVGDMASLSWLLLKRAFGAHRHSLTILGKITFNQVRFSGLQAVPLIAIIATLIGAVSIIQSFALLTGLADSYIGSLLVSIIIRELGPLVTAIILIGRSGTAMATEIGSMRLNGEVEALAAYRIDPVTFIVLPRVVGAAIAMFGLIVCFDIMGILGGFLVSLLLADISFPLLMAKVMEALTNVDVALSLAKAFLFGQAIAALCCYFGLEVRQSPTELPQAVTKAVVASLTSVFLLDGLLAAAFYLS